MTYYGSFTNAAAYYEACTTLIKRTQRKFHRKPDIIEVAKFIQEQFGDGVLLSDFLKTIAMLSMEEKISDSLFFEQ